MTQYIAIQHGRELERPQDAVLPSKPRSLAAQVASKMLFWACLNTLFLTAIGYVFISERAEQRTLAYLSGYLAQRVRAESQVFRAGEANLAQFRRRFLALYRDPKVFPNPDFGAYFVEGKDGAVRMREKFFTGTVDANGFPRNGVSGFIGRRRPPLTKDVKRRLVLASQIIAELGPAWRGQLVNLHATFPENAVIFYWPGVPWGLQAKADSYFPGMGIVKASLQSENPGRKPYWSPLYFDTVARKWNVTYEVPVDWGGKHLINPSHDILLDDLMTRLINEHPPGAYNLILTKDGDLVAHPDRLDDIKNVKANLNVRSMKDPTLLAIYQAITKPNSQTYVAGGVRIVRSEALDAYISFAEIGGPGWWFITVYPRALVLESARETANWLMALGAASFVLMMLVVVGVLRKRVARPITQMKLASEHVSTGDYLSVADGIVRLPEDQDNEIGLLARSFKTMAQKVGDSARYLEQMVQERTLELAAANSELERLSFQDGLTASFNRRGFDRDLANAIEEAEAGSVLYALLLCDVDYFKRYNDRYGHLAGDECLRMVVDEIGRQVPFDRVYRYGGEEIAVLLRAGDEEACGHAAFRVVEAVAALGLPHEESPHKRVTISAGLVPIAGNLGAIDVISAADALLYQAKQAGRNRLIHRQAA